MISRDVRQTVEYAKYMQTIGWQVVKLAESFVYIKKVPLVGNIAKFQRPSSTPEDRQVEELHRRYNLAAIYIEPSIHSSKFMIPGFGRARTCFLPPKTIQIDLGQSLEMIFNQMKQKTRYSIRLAQKRGVVVHKSQQIYSSYSSLQLSQIMSIRRITANCSYTGIDAFIQMCSQSAKRRGMFLSQTKEIQALWNAFGKKADLLLAYLDSNSTLIRIGVDPPAIAGVLMVRSPDTMYYMYAASTKEGNKLFAPSLLVWEAIELAKKLGCKIFDFEGIYDERYPQTKSWKGFTHFKEGFGGETVEYPKTLVKYYNFFLNLLRL